MTDEGCTGEGRGRGHTYTAAEVKVLTETATKVAYTLGRKDAGEEIAEALEALADAIGDGEQREFLIDFADTARDIASQAPSATSDATSGVPGHREVSEDRQAVRKRYPHAHACVTCSPDARQPGPGCINCRQTGWDQTPCQAEGHKPQCPHDCCDPNAQESVPASDEPCGHPDCPCASQEAR